MKKFFLFVISVLIALNSYACPCTAKYKVPSGAGDVTITKIKVSTVQVTIPGLYITLPYVTKWKGSTKIKAGHSHTFSFNVTSNCENGTRQFAFTRQEKKTCYKQYTDSSHPYDLCGLNTNSQKRAAPLISCSPDDWRTSSPRHY